jgi:hypothetical protein
MFMRIFFQVVTGKLEQSGGGTEPVFLKMHERAGELDESLVKISIRAVSVFKPQMLQHIVRLEKKLMVETVEIGEIVCVQFPSLERFDHRGNAGAFFAHEIMLKSQD